MQAATLPDLFEYLEYRVYLKDYFEFKKAGLSSWSYQIFAQQLGFSAKDFLFIGGSTAGQAGLIGAVAICEADEQV